MKNANSGIIQKGPNGKFSAIGFSNVVSDTIERDILIE